MQKVSQINNFPVFLLDKEAAQKYQQQITDIWNLIPLSNHGIEDILKEESGGKPYIGKWQHSLVVLSEDEKDVVAFIVGYERQAEDNEQYPKDSLHLKSISVSTDYQKQGVGRKLVDIWLDYNQKLGYQDLGGDFIFSVQTNSADWNEHVQKFYESFGFQKNQHQSLRK